MSRGLGKKRRRKYFYSPRVFVYENAVCLGLFLQNTLCIVSHLIVSFLKLFLLRIWKLKEVCTSVDNITCDILIRSDTGVNFSVKILHSPLFGTSLPYRNR